MQLKTFLLCLLAIRLQCMEFETTFGTNEKICFSQFIAESSPFHFRLDGKEASLLTMLFKDGTVIFSNSREEKIKSIDSYAAVSGTYQFCVVNLGNPSQFRIKFYEGLELSDLMALPRQQSSKLINQMVDKVHEVFQAVKEQESYSRTVNEYNMELQKSVSFKGVGFGFLSITLVLIISFLHYLEIKRVLKNRKII